MCDPLFLAFSIEDGVRIRCVSLRSQLLSVRLLWVRFVAGSTGYMCLLPATL